ncbi:hypothetical protein [Kribbella sp. NPDC051718]|uniref:hypothetical protein n=1 Tax=Kribbella sp. NPDC051718 TaxID=3155168 RepID=UPI003431F302
MQVGQGRKQPAPQHVVRAGRYEFDGTRQVLDSAVVDPVSEQPSESEESSRICGPAAGRKPNYVALDFYQKPEGGAVRNLLADLNTYW